MGVENQGMRLNESTARILKNFILFSRIQAWDPFHYRHSKWHYEDKLDSLLAKRVLQEGMYLEGI